MPGSALPIEGDCRFREAASGAQNTRCDWLARDCSLT